MLRSLRPLAWGIALTCAAGFSLHAEDQTTLSLPENIFPQLKAILETAVKESPGMISRNAENAIAEQNRIAARAPQLPNVGGYLSYNPLQRDDRADLPKPVETQTLFYALNFTQPVYHWGALESNTRIGQLQQKITQGQTAEAYRLLVQEIRSRFLAIIITKMGLTRAQLNLGIAQDRLDLAQSQLEKKAIAESDLYKPRLDHDQAILAVDRATEDYESSKLALARLSGTPVLTDAQVPSEIPAITPAPDTLRAYFARFNAQSEPTSYTLDAQRKQIEIEKLNYKIVDARLKPTFDLQLGVTQNRQSYTTDVAAQYRVQSTFIGVRVNWSIFDGFATRSAKAVSLARRRQMEQSYEDTVKNLNDTVRSAYKQLGFSARAMEISNRILSSSEGNLLGKKDDVKRGLASESDVNFARLSYAEAQIAAFNSRYDYLLKTGDFLSTIMEDPALDNISFRAP